MTKQARAIWPLLKVRVAAVSEGGCAIAIGAEYGSPTTFYVKHDMRGYDVKVGDRLTLYTEVLLAEAKGES